MSHPRVREESVAAPVPSSTPVTETEFPTVLQSQTPHQSDELSVVVSSIATCGFISGNPEFPITCHAGDSCGHDPQQKLVACCKDLIDGICAVSTRCLDRTMSALENVLGGRDLVCQDTRAPLCKTDILQGEPELDGYSLFICDTDKVGEVIIPFTTASIQASTLTSRASLTETNSSQTGDASDAGDGTSHQPSVGTIVGAVLGSIGGVAAVAAGVMLLRELRKKRGQQTGGSGALARQQGESASRQNYQLVDIQRGPAELPDSPTTVDGQTVSPISPGSPLSPLSPLSMNPGGRGELPGDNDTR